MRGRAETRCAVSVRHTHSRIGFRKVLCISRDEKGAFRARARSDHRIRQPELPGAAELFRDGYVQVLQLDFPDGDDGDISGNWPFGDGLFNLFWRPPFIGEPYFWYVQK